MSVEKSKKKMSENISIASRGDDDYCQSTTTTTSSSSQNKNTSNGFVAPKMNLFSSSNSKNNKSSFKANKHSAIDSYVQSLTNEGKK